MQFHATKVVPNTEWSDGDTIEGEIRISNQECLTVKYMDPLGKIHTLIISTAHRIMLVEHEETNACLIIRPGNTQFHEGTK